MQNVLRKLAHPPAIELTIALRNISLLPLVDLVMLANTFLNIKATDTEEETAAV
jgi:hypothetical protein